jgi:hypothetical protein
MDQSVLVCVYVCAYVCMYVRMYVCMCMCVLNFSTIVYSCESEKELWVYLCMRACVYVCVRACEYMYMYVCVCICIYVSAYLCMHVCVYQNEYSSSHAKRRNVFVCLFVCVCVCVYVLETMPVCNGKDGICIVFVETITIFTWEKTTNHHMYSRSVQMPMLTLNGICKLSQTKK